jgi:hypothetical protein
MHIESTAVFLVAGLALAASLAACRGLGVLPHLVALGICALVSAVAYRLIMPRSLPLPRLDAVPETTSSSLKN